MMEYPLSTMMWLSLLLVWASAAAEHVRDLEISEGAPVGTRIGFIGDGASNSGPPYLIVPVGSSVETDLNIDQNTGEIRTKVQLDRETRSSYSLVAIPISGDNVKVIVKVLDENDNAPTFPTKIMNIEFSENTPRDVKRTLNPAKDLDLDLYNTQRYNIISGNVNDAFRLSSHRERDGVLYLDLQINGFLDRETIPSYTLVIEALDGGTPPLRGEMTVNITIQDVNDNQPIFNQTRYFATVPENATLGTSVLKVFAIDNDSGENGQIEYSINRRQSDRDNMFRIDHSTGLISVNKPLDFETKELHELVIVAKDHGLQPLETTTFVSIRVTDVNDNQPIINVIFLSDDATPKISEASKEGDFVARISVNDPDSKTEYSNVNVTLSGGNGRFGLTTRDNIIYLMIVSMPLDRELQANYTLKVVATDQGNPPLHASKTFNLQITDINDNPPQFEQEVYHANVMEVSDPGTSVIQVLANDKDEGNNSAVFYSLKESPETHSSWFQIDSRSGLITTRVNVDCETDPVPQLTVIATDNGFPPLSSVAKVLVTIHDVNDNEPIFDQSFYNVSVAENEAVGRCIFKISATDPDCGVNAMVNYTIGDGFGKFKEFEVKSTTGEICISEELDYETRNVYEFPVVATDRGGLSTTAMVKIQITDIDDNRPVFYPREYNVSLRENDRSFSSNAPVVAVVATDADSGRFGTASYEISSGNDAGLFTIDRHTGEIFLSRPGMLSRKAQPYHHLNISATDGAGLKSVTDAEVFISVIDSAQRPPIFERARYTFSISENVGRDTLVGNVSAKVSGSDSRNVRYSIYSGDPDQFFKIGTYSGIIRTANHLDHETKSNVLLNIQATSGDPPVYGHTQVNIEILDVNDNAPEFESNSVRIAVPENVDVGIPLYAAHAIDKDSGANGVIRFKIINQGASEALFDIDPKLGHLTLNRHLDYEMIQRHTIIVTATDTGNPPLSSNLTIYVDVQDFNDNSPVFERSDYNIQVSESLPVNSQILQVVAVDLDTGNNARLTYRLLNTNNSAVSRRIFGIFPNSGWLYLRENLDRESLDKFSLIVAATDNGTPSLTATARITVEVLDTNDNDPIFSSKNYEFHIEENQHRGVHVGTVSAKDSDYGSNSVVRFHLIPANTSFQINTVTGQIFTREPLDRESIETYDITVEAKDQGTPSRSSRVPVKIHVTDVNDNSPEIIDPQEDVVSVREEQQPGTEVVKVRAVDADSGENASITYSILKGKDSDGAEVFTIDPISGVIKTRVSLDNEEKTIYRLTVAATDSGNPPRQSFRKLRVGVLDLNDHRPTFTSSSLNFKVREDADVGQIVGSVAISEPFNHENFISGNSEAGHVTYTVTSCLTDQIVGAFDIDRTTGSLIVAKDLDRELQSKYQLEIRALDTSSFDNPQSSAITVTIEIEDVNDNPPRWSLDPITIPVMENSEIGTVLYNFTAFDPDYGNNGVVRFSIEKQFPGSPFSIDSLTGHLILNKALDYEEIREYVVIVVATDQCQNITERLSSSLTARILVRDVNDNSPTFLIPSKPSIIINKGLTVGMSVTQVIATDEDSGENGRVTYILSGKHEHYFSLGYDTGILTLVKPLKDSEKVYNVNITAEDHGNPVRRTEIKLSLHSDETSSESNPKFLRSVFKATISEDASIGAFVAKITTDLLNNNPNGNLTFYMPPELVDGVFKIDSQGKITTSNYLDREQRETYSFPVYIIDSSRILTDVTTVLIKIQDVNDHAPEFKAGSCYRLSIPENNEQNIVHTVTAIDRDDGPNGHITYSITGGNVGNKFSINSQTGELTAKSLDRESFSKYHLTISAQDKGNPRLQSSCNLTIHVEDQNDNDPRFDEGKYSRSIKEDIPVDTSVLRVHASDADIGVNSRIIYSLANESQWLFRIDNKTGVIYTSGFFDRERTSEYTFSVVATDSGKYNARSTKVPVTILIEDVNDNKPIFVKYPFIEKVSAYIQPGHPILTVEARDSDEGINSDIIYSIHNPHLHKKFRINPTSGVLTATQSLASENGQVIYINVIATDKGSPAESSIGLVEISVGKVNDRSPQLIFQNSKYEVSLTENTEEFHDVVKVSAVRTDGRRQKIIYTFGTGNEENIFAINNENGMVQVRNSKKLDYEKYHRISLVVEAKTESFPTLHAYCEVVVNLTDQNDNAPKFSQELYTASVWEENNKGSFVLQTIAFDSDEGQNSRIRYHIVDGNHDNAFKIEPAFSGILKTNIALDREIRDSYRLTVIATDEGTPQMTGTAKIKINILDVNDNHPTFPKPKTIQIPEDTNVGNVLTVISANDVDLYPTLTYKFSDDNPREIDRYFSIDRFSGKITLKKELDFEKWQEYNIKIFASDGEHLAATLLTIRVTDVNDNAPFFTQTFYTASLFENPTSAPMEIIHLNASDLDSEQNSKVNYSIIGKTYGFSINSNGVLQANSTSISRISGDIYLIVKAEDFGVPPLKTLTSVRIRSSSSGADISGRNMKEYRLYVSEALPKGSPILKLTTSSDVSYEIIDGNVEDHFEIIPGSGTLIIMKPLDRELRDSFQLKVSDGSEGGYSTIDIFINIEDSNDNAPVFKKSSYEIDIPENVSLGTSIATISANDADLPGTSNSEIHYEITSGNDESCFYLEENTGVLKVNKTVDYDTGNKEYQLIIRACDKGIKEQCSFTTFTVNLEDSNDNLPKFPVTEYLEFIGENEPIGTAIFTAQAIDFDKGMYGNLNYSLENINGDETSKYFHVDSSTGLVVTNAVFDYEQRNQFTFSIKVTDYGGLSNSVKVRVEIEGKDEYYPQFTEKTYKFTLATSIDLPLGFVVGYLQATDRDKGIDGRVVYQLTTQHNFFKINRTTGAVLVKRKLGTSESHDLGKEVSLVVSANSGRQGSLTNMSVVEILLDPLADPGTNLAINKEDDTKVTSAEDGIFDWALGLFIAIILIVITFGAVFVFLHMKNKRVKNGNKPNLHSDSNNSNNYVDPTAFDTIPIRNIGNSANSSNQFAPPKYDEIPPYGGAHPASSASGAPTTSELSGSEQSGSSGRGSAEDGDDGEDEEIRMINEGLQRDRLHQNEDDNLSDMSVRNTQEYLARLGIVNNNNNGVAQTTRLCSDPRAGSSKETVHHHPSAPLDSLNIYEEETNNDNDISNFYAKLNDVTGNDRASSTDENGGVNTTLGSTMDHVISLATYGEVPNVTHQPSMNGSLSSIVHSEEELAGSYNWDYLLDWGPQYQPLAHVFSEIARLKDDTSSVKSGASGNSSVKSKNSVALSKNVPPPLITSVAPRMLNGRTSSHHNQMHLLPRSPINHDASGASFSTSSAMSPSFSPSLSPLATKSPRISPLVTPGLPTSHHVMRQPPQSRNKTIVETEMRL